MDAEEFRAQGRAVVDMIADYLDTVGSRPVTSDAKPGDIRRRLPEHPPSSPEPFDAILADVRDIVMPGLTHWQHPKFFA